MDIKERRHVAKQLDLFTYEKEFEQAQLEMTIEALKQKYGADTFKAIESAPDTDSGPVTTSFQKDFLDDYKYS